MPANLKLFPAPRTIILTIVLSTLVCSLGIAMNTASSSLLSIHRSVIERLSVLLVDASRTDESVALVRTLTNKYTERQLAEKVCFHGRDLIDLLRNKGDMENARAWDLKLGDALSAVAPGMWQPFFGPSDAFAAMSPSQADMSAKENPHPANIRSYGTDVPMVTALPLTETIPPNALHSRPKQAAIMPGSLHDKGADRPVFVAEAGRYPPSGRSYEMNVPRVTAPALLPSWPPVPAEVPVERRQSISRKAPIQSAVAVSRPMPVSRRLPASANIRQHTDVTTDTAPRPVAEIAPAAISAVAKPAEGMPGVTDKMGFPLSKPLFETPLAVSRPDMSRNGILGTPGIIISRESSNELKGLNSKIVNLNFKDANIADIVLMLADAGGLNIVSRNEIKGKTTITFSDIPVGTALDLILRTNDYTYQVRDDVVWIFKRGEEPISTKVFFVRNIDVSEVLPAIQRTLGQEVGDTTSSENEQFGHSSLSMPAAATKSSGPADSTSDVAGGKEWSVYSDTPSNSLIVTASQSKLEEVSRLLKVLDVGNTDYRLEERVFTLKYIDRESFIKTIKMTLPKFDPEKQIIDIKRN